MACFDLLRAASVDGDVAASSSYVTAFAPLGLGLGHGGKGGREREGGLGVLLIHHGRIGTRGRVGDGGAVLGRYSHGAATGEDDGTFAENPLAALFLFCFYF